MGRKEMEKLGMGAVLGVAQEEAKTNRASSRLHYNRGRGVAIGCPKVCLVGKGVTFDSGGLSIKPWQNMNEMKGDMAGGRGRDGRDGRRRAYEASPGDRRTHPVRREHAGRHRIQTRRRRDDVLGQNHRGDIHGRRRAPHSRRRSRVLAAVQTRLHRRHRHAHRVGEHRPRHAHRGRARQRPGSHRSNGGRGTCGGRTCLAASDRRLRSKR